MLQKEQSHKNEIVPDVCWGMIVTLLGQEKRVVFLPICDRERKAEDLIVQHLS